MKFRNVIQFIPMKDHKIEFYGTATIGEKGQFVIPVGARNALGLSSGDKLLVVGHAGAKKLMIVRPEDLKEFAAGMSAHMESLLQSLEQSEGNSQ